MDQLSFEFESRSPAPASAPAWSALNLAPEQMARVLEQHADYKVLRRLVPKADYGPAPADLVPADARRLLVLDTETTGLSHQADKIIELAMLSVQVDARSGLPFGPVTVFEGFEDPGMPIPPIAQQVTGITDDMVRGQRLADDAVEAMVSAADLVVAHNAGFDRPFVEARFAAFRDKAWACSFMDIDWKAAGAESAKLSALAHDRGWFYDAHRAQVDCHALLQVLCEPVGDGGQNGLALLMAAAQRPSFKLRATGAPFEAKDKLKARAYRWDAEARVWYCALAGEEALAAELAWLRAEVYGARSARVELEALDGLVRYSARPGMKRQEEVPLAP